MVFRTPSENLHFVGTFHLELSWFRECGWYAFEAYDVPKVTDKLTSSCRDPRGFTSLREEQLQKRYLLYAGEGFPPKMTSDLDQSLTNLRREHCLHNGGADFWICENCQNYFKFPAKIFYFLYEKLNNLSNFQKLKNPLHHCANNALF